MSKYAPLALVGWLVLGVVGGWTSMPTSPDCAIDPTAELCDRLASVGTGLGFLAMAFVWLVGLVVLIGVWMVGRARGRKPSPS